MWVPLGQTAVPLTHASGARQVKLMEASLRVGRSSGVQVASCVRLLRAEVRSAETVGPVLVHVVTEKGRGYLPAETAQDKMHGVVKFDPRTGKQVQVGRTGNWARSRGLKIIGKSLDAGA